VDSFMSLQAIWLVWITATTPLRFAVIFAWIIAAAP
jgi:hypothetical protein